MNDQIPAVSSTGGKEDDPSPEKRSDQALVEAFQNGKEHAFDQILNRYQEYIYRVVFYKVRDQNTAEDLAQKTFVNAFEALNEFEGRSSLKTWLYRIAKNVCYSHFRKNGRNREEPVGAYTDPSRTTEGEPGTFPEPKSNQTNPGEFLARKEKQDLVQNVILNMKEQFRTILTLRDLEGHTYEEIADRLDIPIGTVRSRLYRARDALQKTLEDRLGESIDQFLS